MPNGGVHYQQLVINNNAMSYYYTTDDKGDDDMNITDDALPAPGRDSAVGWLPRYALVPRNYAAGEDVQFVHY